MAKSPHVALDYAKYVLEDRFPAGETAIARTPMTSREYAIDVIKGRFPEGEAIIKKYPESWKKYTEFLKREGIEI